MSDMSSVDLNALVSVYGYWTSTNNASISNKPTSGAGAILSLGLGGRIMQFCAMSTNLYFRYKTNSSSEWNSWKQITLA